MTGIEYLVGAIGITVSLIVAVAIFTYFEIERHAHEHETSRPEAAAADRRAVPPAAQGDPR